MLRVYVGLIVALLAMMIVSGTVALVKNRIPTTQPFALLVEVMLAGLLFIWGISLLIFA